MTYNRFELIYSIYLGPIMYNIGIEIQHNIKSVWFVRAYNIMRRLDNMSQGWFGQSNADNDVFGDKRYIQ